MKLKHLLLVTVLFAVLLPQVASAHSEAHGWYCMGGDHYDFDGWAYIQVVWTGQVDSQGRYLLRHTRRDPNRWWLWPEVHHEWNNPWAGC